MEETQDAARGRLHLPAALIIMDGFGLAEPGPGNAISLAKTPHLDAAFAEHPTISLEASGEAVGLPAGQMGNSEVGHLNIGAGRIVHQELSRINRACADGSLQHNQVLIDAFESACRPDAALHFMGLLSDGGVHSSNAHLYSLMDMAAAMGVPRVMIHCFLDGRDVPPSSGKDYVEELQAKVDQLNAEAGEERFAIASVSGRYYAMDRDKRWDRAQKAWETVAHGACCVDRTAAQLVQDSYDEGVTDEFVVPKALEDRGVREGDSVVFFNFRPDRARELTRAFCDEEFEGFDRGAVPEVSFVCLTEYDPDIDAPVAFPKEFPQNVLADVLADAGLRQYHIAETEKYAHVTFFFNGGVEAPYEGEDRKVIPSPKDVPTYDLKPQMSAPEVADECKARIESGKYDVIILNFANCDMVGHTGVFDSAVKAVEAVDAAVNEVVTAVLNAGGCVFLTADHGNAEKMKNPDGTPFTAHTTNPVPFVAIGCGDVKLREGGCLADIAPTMLPYIGLPVPSEMTGKSLIVD